MENFHKGPDVSEAAKVGEPTLVDPKQASAPDMIRAANASVTGVLQGAGVGNKVSVEQVHDGTAPADNAAVPRSDAAPGTATTAADSANGAAPAAGNAPAGTDMKNDLAAPAGSGAAPVPPPTQVNEVAGANTSSSSSSSASSSSSTRGAGSR